MKILVIGGTGFLGRHVVRRLADAGHAVTVFHRGRTRADLPGGVSFLQGDRNALEVHASALRRLAPDVVLDVIPYTERQAVDVAALFDGLAGRLVALSSGDVYRNYDGLRRQGQAPPDPVPLAEDAPLRTSRYPYRGAPGLADFAWRDHYDKILVEQAVLGVPALPGTVLRLPMAYGPGDRQHRLWPYLKPMDDGRPAILLEEAQARWRCTRGYVENVAAAVALAATDERAAGRVYNVGGPEAPTERAWVEGLGEQAGWPGDVVTAPAGGLPDALRTGFDWRYHLATDTSRIRAELGYAEPVAPEEALRRTIAWERTHPPDQALPFDSVHQS